MFKTTISFLATLFFHFYNYYYSFEITNAVFFTTDKQETILFCSRNKHSSWLLCPPSQFTAAFPRQIRSELTMSSEVRFHIADLTRGNTWRRYAELINNERHGKLIGRHGLTILSKFPTPRPGITTRVQWTHARDTRTRVWNLIIGGEWRRQLIFIRICSPNLWERFITSRTPAGSLHSRKLIFYDWIFIWTIHFYDEIKNVHVFFFFFFHFGEPVNYIMNCNFYL